MEKPLKVLDSFMNNSKNCFLDLFDDYINKKLSKRKDYKKLENEIVDILETYKNVQIFLENHILLDMSNIDKEKLLRIIELENDKKYIELKEAFKLGEKEMYIFLKEMNMLNI